MLDFISKMIDNGNVIDIISCVFTVAALIFTLYFWLLDHVSEEETEFLKKKPGLLGTLNKSLNKIKEIEHSKKDEKDDSRTLFNAMSEVNKQMEIVLNYRFWTRGKYKDAYLKVNNFYKDSKYAASAIHRSLEEDDTSLVSIKSLRRDELEDIRSDYQKGLSYTIEFIENWE